MPHATLTLSSKNYSSWSLRGWLMAMMSGVEFEEIAVPLEDEDARAEILLLSPSILVPCLIYEGIKVWDTLAIGEFLNEVAPKAGILPADRPCGRDAGPSAARCIRASCRCARRFR
jgi:glutathione S-transferase